MDVDIDNYICILSQFVMPEGMKQAVSGKQ